VTQIAPSILSADFSRLAEHAQQALAGGATLLHVDVMDGHFVPNITIGPPVVASLRKAVDVPLDCHLMIENADRFIPAFADAGADWISVHQEACVHLNRTLEQIKSRGLDQVTRFARGRGAEPGYAGGRHLRGAGHR